MSGGKDINYPPAEGGYSENNLPVEGTLDDSNAPNQYGMALLLTNSRMNTREFMEEALPIFPRSTLISIRPAFSPAMTEILVSNAENLKTIPGVNGGY